MKETTEHYSKIILNILWAGVWLLIALFVLPKVFYFFLPFVIGWVIAKLANPIVAWLERHLKVKRKAVSALVITLAVAAVLGICYGVLALLYRQAKGFLEDLPGFWLSIQMDLAEFGGTFQGVLGKFSESLREEAINVTEGLNASIGEWVSQISAPTVSAVGNIAMSIPNVLVAIVMCLLSAYFFIADKEYMAAVGERLLPKTVSEKLEIFKNSCVRAIVGYFKAQIRIEVWIYLIMLVAFLIMQVNYAVLVALGIALLDFLPIFGTGTILIPWAVLKLISGEYVMAVVLVALWGGGQLLRQIIQPKYVSESIGLDAIPTLFLLFIGWKVQGVIGMILALPIGILVKNLYEAGAFSQTLESFSMLGRDLSAFMKYSEKDRTYYKHYETDEKCNGIKEENKKE